MYRPLLDLPLQLMCLLPVLRTLNVKHMFIQHIPVAQLKNTTHYKYVIHIVLCMYVYNLIY